MERSRVEAPRTLAPEAAFTNAAGSQGQRPINMPEAQRYSLSNPLILRADSKVGAWRRHRLQEVLVPKSPKRDLVCFFD
jgi:hypothetical protein